MALTHVYLVIDESGSMDPIAREANEAVASWVRGVLGDPDFRVYVAFFSYKTRWVITNAAGQVTVPPIAPGGGTALRDALKAAVDMANIKVRGSTADSVLILGITDGEENASRITAAQLREAIGQLVATGRADVAIMVPPGTRLRAAAAAGLHEENVREWEATARGVREAEATVSASLDRYRTARAAGVGSVGRFFVDAAAVDSKVLARTATPLPTTRVREFNVPVKARIDEFATSRTGNYVVGEWYYQLTKPETVQAHKRLLLDDSGTWYEGDNVRTLLGLGSAGNVRVAPAGLSGGRRVFIQSTSTNRNLIPGQAVVRVLP